MACVLVTRAEPGASETAARLQALGHTVIVAPMLIIKPVATDANTDGFQALLFTSANGVTAFARESRERTLPAFCVGDATGEAATANGFGNVRIAGGDVRALASFVAQTLRPDGGALMHVAGADLAGDLVGALQREGFTAVCRVFYRAAVVGHMPQRVHEALRESVDVVLFHSARGCAAFRDAVEKDSSLQRIAALCLSPAVAEIARGLNWRDVVVAQAPREDALLRLLVEN
ncbi:MAG: uroporphyrinogen-III synthase [Alphaproteobacteria bacterium]|nr:uroporphyrinogen-III synthase [Alphaproteobacteria bacterium]